MHKSYVMHWVFGAFLSLCSVSAISVEEIKPDYDYKSGSWPRWLLGQVVLSIEVPCRISTSPFLPTKECRSPYVVIEKASSAGSMSGSALTQFHLSAGDISIGDKWAFDGNDDPKRPIPVTDLYWGKQHNSPELFRQLMAAPDTRLVFKTRSGYGAEQTPMKIRTIVLADFDKVARQFLDETNKRYDEEQEGKRRPDYPCSSASELVGVANWYRLILQGDKRCRRTKCNFSEV